MQRVWCPSEPASSDAPRHTDAKAACAWQRSVAAANSDISAFHNAAYVPRKVLSVPRFSAAVVASKVNKSYVPVEPAAQGNFQVGAASFGDAKVAMSSAFLAAADGKELEVTRVAVPVDQAESLLSHFAKQPAKGELPLRDVVLLSSLSGTVAVEDVLTAVDYNHILAQNLTALSLAGGTTATKPPGLARFVRDAKSLRCLGLPRCHLSAYMSELCTALLESTVEHVSLAGNDGGVDAGHADENASALAELLKQNKFLLSLDLSANGFSATAVHDMMMALAGSDTKLLPTDLPPKPDVEVIAVDELVNAEDILGGADSDDEEQESDEEADNTDEEEQLEHQDVDQYDGEDGEDGENTEEGNIDEEADDVDSGAANEAAEDGSDSADDEEKEERARAAYERRVARVARQTAREESRMRHTMMRQYVRETRETVATLYYDIVALRAKEEELRTEAFCKRRSGWSRLQWLSLAGNSVGDRGAMGVAATLLDEVKLDEERIREAEEELRIGAQKLLEELVSARRATLQAEANARASLVDGLQSTLSAARQAAEKWAMYGGADEEEYTAPDVVMTNIDDTPADNEDRDDEDRQHDGDTGTAQAWDAGNGNGIPAIDEEGIDTDITQWTLPASSTKRGMNSLRYLDLSGCGIGNRGLKHLAKSLVTNRSVEVLLLRDNKLGKSTKQEASPAAARDDSGTAPSGVVALAQALCSNQALQCLDLSYCRLDASSLRILSESLRENQTLRTLRLQGNNNMGQADVASAHGATSCFVELLQAVCEGGVRHLNLSHNNLETCLWQEEIETLCEASLKLESLELSNTGLTGTHVAKWLDALQDRTCSLQRLHLARNTFTDTADGLVMRALLVRCPQLQELCLDDNAALQSSGIAAMLGGDGHDLPPIRHLGCCHTGLNTPTLSDGTPVLSPALLAKVEHLDLGDVSVASTDLVHAWMEMCQTHCRQLQYLSFWAREVSMEGHMSLARELVESVPSLLYADFGVLLRFDTQRDTEDDLGCIEKELVRRRAQMPV